MMTGELSPREARRMITEKQTAYSHAQIAGVYALLTGGPVEASCEMIYQRAVTANCARLSERGENRTSQYSFAALGAAEVGFWLKRRLSTQ
jgi:hypothetical protein